MKIYKCGNCIKRKGIREGYTNLGGKYCLSLHKVPIKSSRVKGKCRYKDYKNP